MKIHTIIVFTVCVFLTTSNVLCQEEYRLEEGDDAPVFSAPDDTNGEWKLSNYLGKKTIIVYFYPAAMTGGCTLQACAYRDDYANLENADAIVVGISGDKVENLQLFKKANDLNFTLLSDETGEIAKKFGVPVRDGGVITREMEGIVHDLVRGVTTNRWTFVINKKGKIIYINREVDAANDSKNVLQILKEQT